MSHTECRGAHRICSYEDGALPGRCACRLGYVPARKGLDCVKKVPTSQPGHVTCSTDEDCNRNEVCMSWQYDPALEYARKLRSRLSPGGDEPEKHQFCIDAWIIYNNHLEDLDEPRTGGGLRRRNFDSEEHYFSGRRPPRQYNAYGEDMMLIVFLVCILATLVTVHRAACYRQLQDARRNTPLRHILPIPEDRPPPYVHRSPDSADGPTSIVSTSLLPKPLTEAPPPTYEEALERRTGRQDGIEEQAALAGHEESLNRTLGLEVQEDPIEIVIENSTEQQNSANSLLQSTEETPESQIKNYENIIPLVVEDTQSEFSSQDLIINPDADHHEGQMTQSDDHKVVAVNEGIENIVEEGHTNTHAAEYIDNLEPDNSFGNNDIDLDHVVVNIENEKLLASLESEKVNTVEGNHQENETCHRDETVHV